MKISSINSGNVCYAECYLLAYNNNEGNKCDGLDWRAKQVVIQFLSRSDDDVVRQLRLLYKVLSAHVQPRRYGLFLYLFPLLVVLNQSLT